VLTMARVLGETVSSVQREVRDRLSRPTDAEILDRFQQQGINTLVSVPCSITATFQDLAAKRSQEGNMKLIRTTHEGNLIGLSAGIHLATGEIPLIHTQNSGLPNAGDGFISFARVYKIPTLGIVTWRGNSEKDDSEPHQEIGKSTAKLTRAIIQDNIHGDRWGRGILNAVDDAIDEAKRGEIAIVRLAKEAFTPIHSPELPQREEVYSLAKIRKYRETAKVKGTPFEKLEKRYQSRVPRDEAIEAIVSENPDAAILFSNGYTSRAAQAVADRLGNFYNVGYMGGTLALGIGMATSNPDIEVIVVDGDQNAQMSTAKDHLFDNYPPNLRWMILDNGIGASVGTAESLPLAPWYYNLAHVIPTTPDEYGEFTHPRVRGIGVYFDTDEAREMAKLIGPLPAHTQRFMQWVQQQTERNVDNNSTLSINLSL